MAVPPAPNTRESLRAAFAALGLVPGTTVMVHSSLGRIGWTVGGAVSVIRALIDVLGPEGTLAMPAETPSMADPATWEDERVDPTWHEAIRARLPVFDPRTAPTAMGAVPEAFRTYPGTLRSAHPLVSVCAHGRHAAAIVASHPLEFGEGPGSPLSRLYDLDGRTLLLGVGFNRCSALHFAESLQPRRRTTTYRVPVERDGARVWVETRQMASDRGTLFPEIGARFEASGAVARGMVGGAEARYFSMRALVDVARPLFAELPR